MKKLVLIQSLFLGITVILGGLTKIGIISGLNTVHGIVGFTTAVVTIATTFVIIRGNHSMFIKTLSVLTLVFVSSAFFAGRSLYTFANYQLMYGIMIASGIISLILSLLLLSKLTSNRGKN